MSVSIPIENYSQVNQAEGLQVFTFRCVSCDKCHPSWNDGDSVSNYAVRRSDGCFLCSPCSVVEEQKDLQGTSRAVGYISQDGKQVTTFIGGLLMNITESRLRRPPFGRQTTWAGSKYYTFHATDVWGQRWVGQGCGPGVVAYFRRMK